MTLIKIHTINGEQYVRLTDLQAAIISATMPKIPRSQRANGKGHARVLAQRTGLTEGGINGLLSKFQLHIKGDNGAYIPTPKAEGLHEKWVEGSPIIWRIEATLHAIGRGAIGSRKIAQ